MTEEQEYDKAFKEMGSAPLEYGETQPEDKRIHNRGTKGNKGGGRPRRRRMLVIDGIAQDGSYAIVSITADIITITRI